MRQFAETAPRWPRGGFPAQHFWSTFFACQHDLYRADGAAALGRIRSHWRALERSLLLRVELIRSEALDLRARGGGSPEPATCWPSPATSRAFNSIDRIVRYRVPHPASKELNEHSN